ncbi:hypothetical protein HT136_05565 [Novosphingobium profundi]|uniref:hypothetical protein n=1 Tax=Novosphingobium profundi TaxID=1774954 RepID=UPI001BD9B3CC|nr:hypothetical protein [Novosphingobium profundi]MBT0667832.1 hypothetical protein [Novosphingobium profundi]
MALRPAGLRVPPGAWWLAIAALVVLAIVLRALAWSPFDAAHPDELMQYAEQANRLATGHGIRPWETRLGLRNSLIPQLLSVPFWLGRHFAPGTETGYYLARIVFEAFTLLALPGAWLLGAQVSRRHGLVALFVVAVWWESILLSNLLLSESLASALLLLAAGLLLDPAARGRRLGLGGFLLTLAVLVRFQYAPVGLILAASSLWRGPQGRLALLAGAALALAAGALSDLAAGAVPFSWFFINLQQNIEAGRAATFGVRPPWQYALDYYLHFGAAALVVVLGCALASGRRFAPLLVAAVVNIALHSLIAHKEYRFVWFSTLVLLVLAAIGSLRLSERVLKPRVAPERLASVSLLAAMTLWALLNLASFSATGGYSAFRGGHAITHLAIRAANDPKVCRLAVAESLDYHVVPALLPRALPLSIAPKGVYERELPLPRELARAANALILEDRPPAGLEGYRKIACGRLPHETPCLYIRAGTCAPDPVYNYQTALEREDM